MHHTYSDTIDRWSLYVGPCSISHYYNWRLAERKSGTGDTDTRKTTAMKSVNYDLSDKIGPLSTTTTQHRVLGFIITTFSVRHKFTRPSHYQHGRGPIFRTHRPVSAEFASLPEWPILFCARLNIAIIYGLITEWMCPYCSIVATARFIAVIIKY